jgi:DNA repair protein RadC
MKVSSSQSAYDFLRNRIRTDIEEFWIIALNVQLDVLSVEMLYRGTVEYCPTHPRDILRFLCVHQATSFIIYHSHPSGDSTPSRSDLKVTRDLKKLSELLRVSLLDHIIITKTGYSSMADRGFFRKRNESILSHRQKADHSMSSKYSGSFLH